jgi:hypothetical protein
MMIEELGLRSRVVGAVCGELLMGLPKLGVVAVRGYPLGSDLGSRFVQVGCTGG